MPDLELVVARYAEDLKWLRRVPRAVRVTVYDKGGAPGDRAGAIPLENVGYEAHTYLHHVVTRYDRLAGVTVFAQGHPFDHAPSFHRHLRELASGDDRVDDFRWLGFVIDFDDARGERLFRPWSKNADGRLLDLDGFCRALWGRPAKDRFVFYPGAQFVAHADLIRRQPRSFYERALALSASFPDAGHCFERTWDQVFGHDGFPSHLRHLELPIYLRPIRRLGITWECVRERVAGRDQGTGTGTSAGDGRGSRDGHAGRRSPSPAGDPRLDVVAVSGRPDSGGSP